MSSINLNWLAGLHGRSKRMPRPPMRSEISATARALAAERMKLAPDDPLLRHCDEEAAAVQLMLDAQAMHFERKLTACYTIIAALGLALALAIVALVLP